MGYELDSKRNVLASYGVRSTNGKYGSQQGTKDGVVKSAMWTFTYNDLPAAGASNLQYVLPAGATVVSATLYVDTAFAGGTSLAVGTYTSAGVAIDADGLITDANLPLLAVLETAGKRVSGTGAQLGVSVGASNAELGVTATGTFTAGAARVVVEYVYDK